MYLSLLAIVMKNSFVFVLSGVLVRPTSGNLICFNTYSAEYAVGALPLIIFVYQAFSVIPRPVHGTLFAHARNYPVGYPLPLHIYTVLSDQDMAETKNSGRRLVCVITSAGKGSPRSHRHPMGIISRMRKQ